MPAPEVVTREYICGEKAENDIKNCGPKTGHDRKLQGKYRFRRHQRSPEAAGTIPGADNEDGQQRQNYQRQHDSYHHADANRPRYVETTNMPKRGKLHRCLFSLLHRVPEYAFDNFRISFVPTTEIVDRERVLDGCEFLVFLSQRVAGSGAKMEFDESALGLFAPEILHECVNHRTVRS